MGQNVGGPEKSSSVGLTVKIRGRGAPRLASVNRSDATVGPHFGFMFIKMDFIVQLIVQRLP
jgi:hypothetical protein